ncbi:MAG TPA: DUF192 domain-containing protein [Candidatus Deferrimicrobiaceae bacterium]|jgi:hypothetical protein
MPGDRRRKIVNETRNVMLGDRVRVADNFWRRLKGLLGTRSLHPGDGLWISPCDAVHTLGMRYPIDLVFIDGSGVVVGCCPGLPPNRISPRYRKACGVLELPAGMLARTGTEPGDRVRFEAPRDDAAALTPPRARW